MPQVGEAFIKEWPGKGLQHAESYMEGLTAEPFSDPHSGAYPWLEVRGAPAARYPPALGCGRLAGCVHVGASTACREAGLLDSLELPHEAPPATRCR